MSTGFNTAEKFHKNFFHDEMEDYEIEADRPYVHLFVHRVLGLLGHNEKGGVLEPAPAPNRRLPLTLLNRR